MGRMDRMRKILLSAIIFSILPILHIPSKQFRISSGASAA
jgi:hypothetical protein